LQDPSQDTPQDPSQDPREFAVPATLRNGTPVTIRAVHPDDGGRIHDAFRHLGRQTVYNRFMGYKRDVTEAELRHITGVDFDRDVALLVTIGSGDTEEVIGGASYFAIDSNTPSHSAELAFTVEEEYQGKGMASSLLRHLILFARRKGVLQFEAEVLTSNLPMLDVFRASGLPMTLEQDGDVTHVTLSLRPEPRQGHAGAPPATQSGPSEPL
jgi:RimJ/RimL family protein N-acetyltransferase